MFMVMFIHSAMYRYTVKHGWNGMEWIKSAVNKNYNFKTWMKWNGMDQISCE